MGFEVGRTFYQLDKLQESLLGISDLRLYLDATDMNYSIAQLSLATMYRDGIEVDKDPEKAKSWHARAFRLGTSDMKSRPVSIGLEFLRLPERTMSKD